MTEAEAQTWLQATFGEGRYRRVATFLDMVVVENERQNLLSPASIPLIWTRHVADSAQLLRFAPNDSREWLDVGTGGGFPGMVVAILSDAHVTMVEPRRRRVEFLQRCVDDLGLTEKASVILAKVEQVALAADVISARAVASVEKLLQLTQHCATAATRWIMPRGRSLPDNLGSLERRFEMVFHVEQSITDDESSILIGQRI